MTAPVIRQFVGTIPDKGQAQTAFDTNVDAFLDWQALQFAPDLVAFGTFASDTAAALVAANLPSLAGRALDAVRVNAAANGVEFANVTAAGWALLDDANATAQRVTLGVPPIASPTFTGTATAEMVRLTSTRDASVSSTEHAFQIGLTDGANLRFDGNEILAVDNGAVATFNVNRDGGDVYVGHIGGSQLVSLHGQVIINGSDFVASGTAPLYACRAWVNFNGMGTVAIRASGNVSSITDNGTGDYTVNFATAMQDANFAISGSVENTTNHPVRALSSNTQTAGAVRITTGLTGSTSVIGRFDDCLQVAVAIFR